MNYEEKKLDGRTVAILVGEGGLVGILAGLAVSLYSFLIDNSLNFITNYYKNANLTMILPLLIGFLILSYLAWFFIKWAPLSGGSGIPQVVGEIYGKFNMEPVKVMVSKFVGGTAAALGGLSLGKEGPSVQIGGASGKIIAKLTKREDLEKGLIAAGAGAGLAGAFFAPMSGIIITLEEFTKTFNPFVLIPTISACLVTTLISKLIFGTNLMFSFTVLKQIPLRYYSHLVVLAVLVSIIGVIFNRALQKTKNIMDNSRIKPVVFTYLSFLLAIVLGLSLPQVLGGGHGLIEEINSSNLSLKLLVLILIVKLIFTAVCFGTGVQGGTLVPTLAIGALTGAIYFYIVTSLGLVKIDNYFLTNFIILGMAGMLGSVVRSPLTSIMIVLEMTGSYRHFTSFVLVVIISYLIAYLLKSEPFYETLLEGMLKNSKN